MRMIFEGLGFKAKFDIVVLYFNGFFVCQEFVHYDFSSIISFHPWCMLRR